MKKIKKKDTSQEMFFMNMACNFNTMLHRGKGLTSNEKSKYVQTFNIVHFCAQNSLFQRHTHHNNTNQQTVNIIHRSVAAYNIMQHSFCKLIQHKMSSIAHPPKA